MKDKKNIANYIKKWYEEFKRLDVLPLDNAQERKQQRDYISACNFEVIKKIAHLLKSGQYENSGFSFKECDAVVYYCYKVIKSSLKKEKLTSSEKKNVELCKLVMPYLYENMEADELLTLEMITKLSNQLDEINMDKSCLQNAKNCVEEETL